MALTLYGSDASGPCRMVHMTLEIIGKKFTYKQMDLTTGDQKSPEYTKLNPQQSVPTLTDGDYVLTESRAIATYIASAYGKDTNLFPADEKIRGKILQRMYFEMGTFYKAFGECAYPVCFKRIDHVPDEKLDALKKTLSWASDMVKVTGFIAETKDMSVADVVFLANFTSMVECGFYQSLFEDFPALKTWFETCKSLVPNYAECNEKGAKMFGWWYKAGLQK